jgi:thiol-disulfide isomerase/thioredoxin
MSKTSKFGRLTARVCRFSQELWEFDPEYTSVLSQTVDRGVDGVVMLNDDNFDTAVESVNKMLVLFTHETGKGFEEIMKKEMATAVKLLEEGGHSHGEFSFGIHASEEPDKIEKYKIASARGIAAYRLFRGSADSGVTELEGDVVTASGLAAQAKRAMQRTWCSDLTPEWNDCMDVFEGDGDAAESCKTQIQKKLDETEKAFVGFYNMPDMVLMPNMIDGPMWMGYVDKNVRAHPSIPCYFLMGEGPVEAFGFTEHPSLAIFKKGEDRVDVPQYIFQTEHLIKQFISAHSRSLVLEFGKATYNEYASSSGLQLVIATDADNRAAHMEVITEVAKHLVTPGTQKFENIHASIADLEGAEEELWNTFWVEKSGGPVAFIAMTDKTMTRVFPYHEHYAEGAITAEGIKRFVNDTRKGHHRAPVYVLPVGGKSQRNYVNATNDRDSNNGLVSITAKTYLDWTHNGRGKGKDLLLAIYSPTCGHCGKMMPQVQATAEKFKSINSLVVAQLDATENNIPGLQKFITGYPTILFYPANDHGNPLTYLKNGYDTVETFSAYLKTTCDRAFKLKDERYGQGKSAAEAFDTVAAKAEELSADEMDDL